MSQKSFWENNKQNIIIGALVGFVAFIFGLWLKSRHEDRISNVGGKRK